jgi:hypothetical protein
MADKVPAYSEFDHKSRSWIWYDKDGKEIHRAESGTQERDNMGWFHRRPPLLNRQTILPNGRIVNNLPDPPPKPAPIPSSSSPSTYRSEDDTSDILGALIAVETISAIADDLSSISDTSPDFSGSGGDFGGGGSSGDW